MNNTSNKIVTWAQAKDQTDSWKIEDQQIVFTNGCFDIVHLGHIDYLEKAKAKGSKLVVGLNTDESVNILKGPSRPLVDEYARCRMMAAFEFVDLVVLFNEPTPLELISHLLPNILVKGNDYTVAQIVGAQQVINNGGRVETIELVQGYSTTKIIDKILNQK